MRMKCLGFALFAAVFANSVSDGAGCPGNESTLAKDLNTFGTMHGSLDSHVIERYMNYPWTWSKCYEEFEDDGFSAQVYEVAVGPALFHKNCSETTSSASATYSGSVSISVSRTGSYGSEIGAQLGWKEAGSVSFGASSNISWTVSGTFTGSASVTVSGVPANTKKYFWPAVEYRDAMGGRYTYFMGSVDNWCDTHSLWGISYADQIDYYDLNKATSTYVDLGIGLVEDACTPCECSKAFNGSTNPLTLGPSRTFTAGYNFYNR